MSDAVKQPGSRWRPRFSLLGMILFTAIVGLIIVVVLQWREIGPLRAANRAMRTEIGLLNIEDPKKASAIRVNTDLGERWTWKWRIYLPPGGKYRIFGYSGHLPSRESLHGKDWFEAVKSAGTGFGYSGDNLQGEFTMEARLVKEGDKWMLYTEPGGGTSVFQASGDALSDAGPVGLENDVGVKAQTNFGPGESILLMHLAKPMITKLPSGGLTSSFPKGAAEGVALWIEQSSPITNSNRPAP